MSSEALIPALLLLLLLLLHLISTTRATADPMFTGPNCTVRPPLAAEHLLQSHGQYPCQYTVELWELAMGCLLHLSAPSGQIKLTFCSCPKVHLYLRLYDNGTGEQSHPPAYYLCHTEEPKEIYTSSRKAVVYLKYRHSGRHSPVAYSTVFNITEVSEDDYPGLVATFVNPSCGYLRPSHDLARLVMFKDCRTLTAPSGSIIFLTRLQPVKRGELRVLTASCGKKEENATELKPWGSNIFSWITSDNNAMSLSYYFRNRQHISTLLSTKFELVFSFHRNTSRPVQIGERWNCSISVWPDLYRHFPCDLISQCEHGEDETACGYGWKTRLSSFMPSFSEKYHHFRFEDLDTICRERGAVPISFHSTREWGEFVEALIYPENYFVKTIWVALHPVRFNQSYTKDSYIRKMYVHTWKWRGGAVAYYLEYTMVPTADGSFAIIYPRAKRPSVLDIFTVKDAFSNTLTSLGDKFSREVPYQWCGIPVSQTGLIKARIVIGADHRTTSGCPVPVVTCPVLLHVTHLAFACDLHSLCPGQLDSRGSTVSHITASCRVAMGQQTAAAPYFICQTTGKHVPYSLVCDLREDCQDNSDEVNCHFPPCGENSFSCGSGQCIHSSRICDRASDCRTSADEIGCHYTDFDTVTYSVVKPPAMVNLDGEGHFTVVPLADGTAQCPPTHYQCPGDGFCLPIYTRCNGMHDCPGQEDEMDCDAYTCEGLYRCRGLDRKICMHVQHLCDGAAQCPQQDDELMCQMDEACCDQCVCFGNPLARSETVLHLRYVDARGTGLTLDSVINNTMLIHLNVASCGWRTVSEITLPNLRVLDLSDNLLYDLNINHLTPLKNLRELTLAGNPLSSSLSGFSTGFQLTSLVRLNMSSVLDQHSNLQLFSDFMPEVLILDLSFSGLESLKTKPLFRKLQILNLQGCPVSDFSPDFMKEMQDLKQVTGDNYKLCCSAVLPESFTGKCDAPVDEISSCENLLRSAFYAFSVFLFAVFAVAGNLTSFVYRVKLFYSGKNRVGFAVFVIHLAMSDFVMGLYLLIIGTADRVYAGVYLWHDIAWRHSATCSIAGFLSFLSCEASSFFISLITLDRFLVIHFPFSRLRFGVTSALIACVMTWGLGMILASIPLLPVTANWAFYRQKGICIPLPVTRTDFPGSHYSFSVMIVINLVMFLLIAIGQSLIYWSVTTTAMSDDGLKSKDSVIVKSTSRSKEATIARRLLVIAMSDFLCWFPIGVCGLLAKLDIPVSGEVNAAMATVVLPFNAALNPFLYTYTALRQKQEKERENNLKTLIITQVKNEINCLQSSRNLQ